MSIVKPLVSPDMSPGKAPTLARTATMAQIAKHVGVSKAAVSVVLNNSSSKVRVSDATRQRILDAARELSYQPSVLARSLQKRRTNIVGFCALQKGMMGARYPFYAALLDGLLMGCEDQKKNFLIHGTFSDVGEDEIYQELLNGQIDGLILYAGQPSPLLQRLAESHLPVVTVADVVPGLPCVTVDAESGGRQLASYLISKGYRRILFWVPQATIPSSIEQRLAGFRTEALKHGIEVEVYWPKSWTPYTQDLQEIMARDIRPQAIASFSDFTANVLISSLQSAGIRVPQDVAVTGFDGVSGPFGNPTNFTTVLAPWDKVARIAVSLIVQQCDGEAIPMLTQIPVELLAGQTA